MSAATADCLAGRVTINTLPDDVLLRIFHINRVAYLDGLEDVDRLWRLSRRWHRSVHVCQRWHQLVHVSRRWRCVVFASPNYLDLKLVCGPRTRVELTCIWPSLPIIIRNVVDFPMPEDYDFDAAIVHHSRVCEINLLRLNRSQFPRLASAMQQQFPMLAHLMLGYLDASCPPAALPDGFLGGSAPALQSLRLHSVPFPALPKILLSATHLVNLSLVAIPHHGGSRDVRQH